jgi:hypothetical protein
MELLKKVTEGIKPTDREMMSRQGKGWTTSQSPLAAWALWRR